MIENIFENTYEEKDCITKENIEKENAEKETEVETSSLPKLSNEEADQIDDVCLWKRRHRRSVLRSAIMFSLIDIIFIVAFFSSGTVLTLKNLLSVSFIFLCFAFLSAWLFHRWKQSFSWTVTENCTGVVATKICYDDKMFRRKRKKEYYVIAETDEGEIKGRCDYSTYQTLEVGELILLFRIGTKEVTAVAMPFGLQDSGLI